MREVPGTFIYFLSYRGTIRSLKKSTGRRLEEDPTTWMILTGGATAGLSFWGLFYPIDLIKSQMQTQQEFIRTVQADGQAAIKTSTTQQIGVARMLMQRVNHSGFMSLYQGYSVTIPRAIISNACIFLVYEYCRTFLDRVAP